MYSMLHLSRKICEDRCKHLIIVFTLGKKVGAGPWWLEGDLYDPLVP